MTVDLVIKKSRVVTPGGVVDGGVAVDDERIVAVGPDATLPGARRTLDARGQYVLPGLIDAHVHMASEEDASIEEGLAQNMPVETDGALHGGVTTLAHFVGQRHEPLLPNIRTTIREGNQKAVDTTRAHVEANEGRLTVRRSRGHCGSRRLGHARRLDRGRQSKTRAIRCSRAPRTPVSRYSITAT